MTPDEPRSRCPSEDPSLPPFSEADAALGIGEWMRSGEAAVGAGRHAEARDCFQQARALAERFAWPEAIERAALGLAWTALCVGQVETALGWARQAAEARGSRPSCAPAAWAWMRAEARLAAGRVDEALQAAERARDTLDAGSEGFPLGLAGRIGAALARASLRRGDPEAALAAARWGLSQAGERPPAVAAALAEVGAEAAAALGRWDEARALLGGAIPDAVSESGDSALFRAGWDGLSVVLGGTDLLVCGHGGLAGSWSIPGGAEAVRRIARQVGHALAEEGPVSGLLGELGDVLAPALHTLRRRSTPLVVATHRRLSGVPWDLLPVDGRPLGRDRPVALAHHLGGLRDRAQPSNTARGLFLDPSVAPRDLLWSLRRSHPGARPELLDPGDLPVPVDAAWTILVVDAAPRRWRAWSLGGDATGPASGGVALVVFGGDPRGRHGRQGAVPTAWGLVDRGLSLVIAPAATGPIPDGVAFVSAIARRLDAGVSPLEAWAEARASQLHEATARPGLCAWRLLLGDPTAATSPLG